MVQVRRQAAQAELREKLKAAGVSSVEIERPGNKLRYIIRPARPGNVNGRKGAEIEKLKPGFLTALLKDAEALDKTAAKP